MVDTLNDPGLVSVVLGVGVEGVSTLRSGWNGLESLMDGVKVDGVVDSVVDSVVDGSIFPLS